MIYRWGIKSNRILAFADPDIVRVFNRALSLGLMDITIIQSIRERDEQDEYFKAGKSRVKWPHSKHNILNPFDKALALDAAPYVNGKASDNYNHCVYLAGIILAVAKIEKVSMRWGGNWDMDGEPITDQDFQDLWHYEKIKGVIL